MGFDIRSKPKTLDSKPTSCSELPIWNYDGSSTGQAPGADSEVLLRPVAIFDDPFRGGDNVLVLCETLTPAMEPIPTNTRAAAKAIFDQKLDEKPWFGIEREYTLYELDKKTPLGWPVGGFPGPQGPYYCSAGADVSFGCNVMDDHYKACLYAGITIAGTNAEVMPGQWEYQIGPCVGIDSGDHMWMSRYLMIRVCELLGVNVTFDPKPMAGDWNGAGCHTNYSTEKMRNAGGYTEIISAIEKLKVKPLSTLRPTAKATSVASRAPTRPRPSPSSAMASQTGAPRCAARGQRRRLAAATSRTGDQPPTWTLTL